MNRKKPLRTLLIALPALAICGAAASDPITDFLLGRDSATVAVPPPPAIKKSESHPAGKMLDVEVNPNDDALLLEAPYDGSRVTPEDVAARFRDAKALMRRICQQPSNQAYFDKTPCLATTLTDDQASDDSKITSAQKKAAERVFRQIEAVNEKTRKIMLASGQSAHKTAVDYSRSTIDPKVSENQNALLTGERSWGDYNRRRMSLTRQAR